MGWPYERLYGQAGYLAYHATSSAGHFSPKQALSYSFNPKIVPLTKFLHITAYHLNLLGLLTLIFLTPRVKCYLSSFLLCFGWPWIAQKLFHFLFFLQAPLYVNTTSVLTCPPGKIVLRVFPRNWKKTTKTNLLCDFICRWFKICLG